MPIYLGLLPSNNEANKATKIYRLFTGALYLAEMSLSVPHYEYL